MNQPASPYANWYQMLADSRFAPSSGAIRDYLRLTDGLESPVPYNVWSFLSMTAALCGDQLTLRHGPTGRMKLNMGVILTGAPAIRKSTALTVMQKFAEGLPLYYGPTDTAGQRQGIMSAMMPRWQKDSDDEGKNDLTVDSLRSLSDLDSDSILSALPNIVQRSPSEIYFVSKELGRLIGSTTRELLDFFTDGMDGEAFHYQLKNQVIKIGKPLINLIGTTTPASLGQIMPRGATEHGFLSRLMFVHASSVSKVVPIPEVWNSDQLAIRESLHVMLMDMIASLDKEIALSDEAEATYTDLYGYQPPAQDARLQAYTGRRQTHLIKLAALLAVQRGKTPVRVTSADLRLAHGLLTLTEANMERAFYGLHTGTYSQVLSTAAELAESTSDGIVSLKMVLSHGSHLDTRERLTAMLVSLQEQGKLVLCKGIGTSDDPHWELNTESAAICRSRLHAAFRKPPGSLPLGEDEFVTHKSQIKSVETKKGDSG